MDFPDAFLRIPERSGDRMLQLDMFNQAMLIDDVPKVLPDLGRFGVILRPIGISRPGKLV